jgi:oxygen-dependent protoporphyrinogen oxidase
MTYDAVIVVGGISGLATACLLARSGFRVQLLERQATLGGNIQSEAFKGFLMEHGPSSVIAGTAALDHFLGLPGLRDDRCELGPLVQNRYLQKGFDLVPISIGPMGFFRSDYLPLTARLRMLAEPFVPRRAPEQSEESVAQFWGRRFGKTFAERVIDPLAAGIFAGRAEEMSMAAAFPAALELEQRYGSLSRAVLQRMRRGGRMPGRRLFSWRGGIGSLPRAIAGELGPRATTGHAVRRITRRGQGFLVDVGAQGQLSTRSVILATQPHVSAALLENLDNQAASAAGEICAPPLAVVFLGYAHDAVAHPLDGLGYLVPSEEKSAPSGVLFCSSMYPERAPDGYVSLTAYLGGARAPNLTLQPASELIDISCREVKALLGTEGPPVLVRARQWPLGLPQYELGHGSRLKKVDTVKDRQPGIFLVGNYFRGPGIAACLTRAEEVAEDAGNFLSESCTHSIPVYNDEKAIAFRQAEMTR